MRRICCNEHGQVGPTPDEDAARGIFTRYVRGILTCSVVCDTCNKELPKGTEAVALTSPTTIREWESEYMIIPARVQTDIKQVSRWIDDLEREERESLITEGNDPEFMRPI